MSVADNALTINNKKTYQLCPTQKPQLIINTQTLNNINVGGKIILHAMNVKTEHLTLRMGGKSLAYIKGNINAIQSDLGGKSELHLDVTNSDSIKLTMGGKSTLYLTGTTKNLTIVTGGKAVVNAKDLSADDVNIMGAGKSNITIHANKKLSIMAAGDTHVKYYGNPSISKNTFGQSIIEKAN